MRLALLPLLFLVVASLVACAPGELDADALLDPDSCAACHPVHFEQWSGSMHAYTGVDPLFTAMNQVFLEDTGDRDPDYCVSCHSPMAVRAGESDLATAPDHLKGVTCVACHLVDEVPEDHNAGQSLADDGVIRGGIADPVETGAHDSKYSLLHDRNDPSSSSLCGACHCVFTPDDIHVERTFFEWRETVFASHDLTRLTCSRCHMRGTNGPVAVGEDMPIRRRHDHSWPGVDVALTNFPGRDEQLSLIQGELDDSLYAQLCVEPGPAGVEVAVRLENVGGGHSFPSGSTVDRRVWVEIRAFAGKEEIFSSGVVEDGQPVTANGDPTTWLIRDQHEDANGDPVDWMWQAETVRSNLLEAPVTLDPTSPAYLHYQERRLPIYTGIPDRVTMRVRMRATALEVFDALAEQTDLDPNLAQEQPTFDLGSTVLEWTGGLESLGTCVD
ncbi:MAG: hypothetical protein GY898_25295 [Proteobacteria bacterium]|nr:hypothetical protein [Pseudomonadota bacterium]